MYGSKGWIFPVIVLITLIAIIWIGISQCKTNENVAAINDNAIYQFSYIYNTCHVFSS
jgi:hypothetical protein